MHDITSIEPLIEVVRAAGEVALKDYRCPDLVREGKPDGSLVTKADRAVQALLTRELRARHPEAGILGEEGPRRPFDASRPCTFVIDPIDGTTSFAAGVPGWCVCLGMLDAALRPVAGIVWAPAWDSLFFADVDPATPALWNGQRLPRLAPYPDERGTPMLLVGSRTHRVCDIGKFPGKIRSLGSSALHLCLVARAGGFVATHIPRSSAWDLVAAHAIGARVGLRVEHASGGAVAYDGLAPSWKLPGAVLAGEERALERLRAVWG